MSKYYLTDPFAALDKMFANTTTAAKPSYPPYNIIKFNDNEYALQFAVAGFKKPDIDISVEKGTLVIDGTMAEMDDSEGTYVHKGIAGRKFKRLFTLPEYFEVDGANLEDGMLWISLKRNVPEEKKPKKITIE
jgi:molecular chaperone IbpA